MSFYSQRYPYEKELTAQVVKFQRAQTLEPTNGTLCAAVCFDHSVLFPEGGGQLGDTGTIKLQDSRTWRVTNSLREGDLAWHLIAVANETDLDELEAALAVGVTVKIQVDWTRRLDLMQQHTGQHLVSSVLLKSEGWTTNSWKMHEHADASDLVNEYITKNYATTTVLVEESDIEKHGIRTRGLPKDAAFPLRCIKFVAPVPKEMDHPKWQYEPFKTELLDVSLCCGTHVNALGELQGIVIDPNFSRVAKGISRIYFAAGCTRIMEVANCGMGFASTCRKMLNAPPGPAQVDAIQRLIAKTDDLSTQVKTMEADIIAAHLHATQLERRSVLTRGELPPKMTINSFPSWNKAMITKYAYGLGWMDTLKVTDSLEASEKNKLGTNFLHAGVDNALLITGVTLTNELMEGFVSKVEGKGLLVDGYHAVLNLQKPIDIKHIVEAYDGYSSPRDETYVCKSVDAETTSADMNCLGTCVNELAINLKNTTLKVAEKCSYVRSFNLNHPWITLGDLKLALEVHGDNHDAIELIHGIITGQKSIMKEVKMPKPGRPVVFT